MTTLYRYKNNRKADGSYSNAHFIIENGVVYKLSGCDEYIIGSKDIASEFGEKYYVMGTGCKPLIEFKIYKNGNTHLKLDIEFCKAMNVEVARLLGWIQSKVEIANEFPDDMKDAGKYFGANFRFCLDKPQVKLLG